MGPRFDWDDLRFFLAVARTGGLSAAGRTLGTDHATVARRIAGLERALRVKLFERNPRGYNLTQPGERLLASAQGMEAEAMRAEREVGGEAAATGVVRLSCLEGFGNFFLAGRIGRFAERHPHLSVELAIQQIVALSRREADIAVVLDPPGDGRFVRERLTDYALGVYGSRAYLDRAPAIGSRRDLLDHRFVGYIDDLVFMRGLDYLDEVATGVRSRLQSSSLHAQMEAAASGYGLCVLPCFIAARCSALIPVLPEEVGLRRTYWLVTHADVADSLRVRLLRRFLHDEVAAEHALFGAA